MMMMTSSTFVLMIVMLLAAYPLVITATPPCIDLDSDIEPDWKDKAGVTRWLIHRVSYGTLSTIHKDDGGSPFANIVSFADDENNGIIYFKKSHMDVSLIDFESDIRCSLTLSAEQINSYCTKMKGLDPQDPRCPRLTLSGTIEELIEDDDTVEYNIAKSVLYKRHPIMAKWDDQGFHDWAYLKLNISQGWLVDMFGGPAILSNEEITNVNICPTTTTTTLTKTQAPSFMKSRPMLGLIVLPICWYISRRRKTEYIPLDTGSL